MLIYLGCLVVLVSCSSWSAIDGIMSMGIAERAFPGGVVAIANGSSLLFQKSYGSLGYVHDLYDSPAANTTKYDIASITKVLGTTLALMNLHSSNTVKPTDLVSKYIPNYDTNKKGNTTLANLLLHNAGLPYDYPGALPPSKAALIDGISFIRLDNPVGTKFAYSNLGFIMLGQVIETATKRTLNDYYSQNRVFAGLKDTDFNPPAADYYRIAPTEYDAEIRKDIVRGQAHERLSYVMGGVSGHSGYFSVASDLIRYMQILLNKGKLPNELRILPEETVNLFTSRVEGLPYANTRAYGFDTSCPGTLINHCFGHDGSTGISAWADKDRNLIFVVMTNRGHPDAKNNLYFQKYKNLIADAVIKGL